MSYLNISHIGLINFFFLKTSTRKIQSFILFKILNFSFLKISSYITSLTINKLKLKNYIKLKKKKKTSWHVWSALRLLLLLLLLFHSINWFGLTYSFHSFSRIQSIRIYHLSRTVIECYFLQTMVNVDFVLS